MFVSCRKLIGISGLGREIFLKIVVTQKNFIFALWCFLLFETRVDDCESPVAGEVAVGGPEFCYGMSAAHGVDARVMDLGTAEFAVQHGVFQFWPVGWRLMQ